MPAHTGSGTLRESPDDGALRHAAGGRRGGLSSIGRALDCGSRGYGFDPRRPPHHLGATVRRWRAPHPRCRDWRLDRSRAGSRAVRSCPGRARRPSASTCRRDRRSVAGDGWTMLAADLTAWAAPGGPLDGLLIGRIQLPSQRCLRGIGGPTPVAIRRRRGLRPAALRPDGRRPARPGGSARASAPPDLRRVAGLPELLAGSWHDDPTARPARLAGAVRPPGGPGLWRHVRREPHRAGHRGRRPR